MRTTNRALRRRAAGVCAGLMMVSAAAARPDRPEVEPNDNKPQATVISTLSPGDTISGNTTGTSTAVPGGASADYFDITTSPAGTPGWYRYRLVLQSATAGHTATIRGITQTAGVPNLGSDTAAQTASATSSPPRFVQWYAGEGPSQIYYRVVGTGVTTSDYVATLERDPVPVANVGTLQAGPVTITTIGQGHSTDTDIQLFDGNRVIIAGNDDESPAGGGTGSTTQSLLRRTLTPGTYYVGLGVFNTATNQPAQWDEDFLLGALVDFPNVMLTSATAVNQNVSASISDGLTTILVPRTRTGLFEIPIFAFTVANAAAPTAVGSQTPSPVIQGESVKLTLTLTPGQGATLESIGAVTGDVSAVSGSPADNAVVFARQGLTANWTYEVASAQGAIGSQPVTFTIANNSPTGSPGSGGFLVAIAAPAAPNDACGSAISIPSFPFSSTIDPATAGPDIDVLCNASSNSSSRFGVWYHVRTGLDAGTLSIAETGPNDVALAVFRGVDCDHLIEVGCTDAENPTSFSLAKPDTDYWVLVSLWSATATTVPTGNYVLAFNFVPVRGACCTDTSCAADVTAGGCSGIWLGPGTACDAAPQYQRTNLSISIPDYAGTVTPVTTTLTVPPTNTATINTLEVRVGLSHAFAGDLRVRLTGPDSTSIDLMNRPGTAGCIPGELGASSDLLGSYTFSDAAAVSIHSAIIAGPSPVPSGRYRPSMCGTTDSQLSAFSGRSQAGTWTLSVSDEDEAISGTLTGFAILFNGGGVPCAVGACCSGSGCTTTGALECEALGGVFDAAGPCGPGSCAAAPAGACCSGATCMVTAAGSCSGFAASFAGVNTTCNAFGGNNTSPCCLADYNHTGGVTVQDIFDFLAGYFTGDPRANINGNAVTVQDIFDFLAAYFAGGC